MLQSLNIENVAIIDRAEIDFTKGFNLLTGETGAGKSIIVDAIHLILGERASKELIRSGKEQASAEAVFTVGSESAKSLLEENGIPLDEDNLLIVRRDINSSGKSVCRLNGRTVTGGILKSIMQELVAIHGQNDQVKLLDSASHLRYLDRFGGAETEEVLKAYSLQYDEVQKLSKALLSLRTDERERERRADMLRYETEEIASANLEPGEEERLVNERRVLRNGEKLLNAAAGAYGALYGGEEVSAYSLLAQSARALEEAGGLDETLQKASEAVRTLLYQAEEQAGLLKDYLEKLETGGGNLDEIEARLDVLYKLKRKYGESVEDVIAYGERAAKELFLLTDSEAENARLTQKLREEEEKLSLLSEKLHTLRQKNGKALCEAVQKELSDLEMGKMIFEAEITEEEKAGRFGKDRVTFMISTNEGEPLKPLAKIASGGELSRIMLALQTVLVDAIETLIFDEVDTGVSGRAAQKVAEKLAKLGKEKQVLCITHLPQIAAMADEHFLIEKETKDGHTSTSVKRLDEENRIGELARMLGGAEITELTRSHAEELLTQGRRIKNTK